MRNSSLRYSAAIFLFCIFVCSPLFADNENSQISYLEKTHQTVMQSACDMELISKELAKQIFENAPQEFKDIVAIIEEAQRQRSAFCHGSYYQTIMPSRILLVGAPGVGKSTLARLMAQLLNRALIFVRAPMLGTEYQNSEIVNLAQIFEAAFTASREVILVLDEINILAEPRKSLSPNNDASIASVLWLLLDKCLEYPHILVVGTCNNASKIPDQLKDRFLGNIIQIQNSTKNERYNILKSCCNAHGLICNDEVLRGYAAKTEGFSVRQLQALVAIAHKLSFIEKPGVGFISEEIFNKAIWQLEHEKSLMRYKKRDILRWMEEYSYVLPWVSLGSQAILFTATVIYYYFSQNLKPFKHNYKDCYA